MGMITSRVLQNADIAALERLLLDAPQYNVFHQYMGSARVCNF